MASQNLPVPPANITLSEMLLYHELEAMTKPRFESVPPVRITLFDSTL